MRSLYIAIIITSLFSCKKTEQPLHIDLQNTSWNLYYKYEGFSFYAQTELRFHSDTTFENIGISDTVFGTWTNDEDSIRLYFENNAYFHGIAITNDSLTGSMRNASVDGVWSAGRK